jgi:glycosyltransferase involved in cell wall biosynthesis
MKVERFNRTPEVLDSASEARLVKVCMHVLGSACNDVRAMRAASALLKEGFGVRIVDFDSASTAEETIDGIRVRHLTTPPSFATTRFRRWALAKGAWMFIQSILWLMRTPADIYHALDLPALLACYVAAKLHGKPLIFESYELPFSTLAWSDMSLSRRLLQVILIPLINHVVPRCAGAIGVSPPIVEEMQKRYHPSRVSLVRNILPYRDVAKGDRFRQLLGLGPQVRIALYQGYLQPDRGLEKLILAAPFLDRDIVIVMMGKDMAETQAKLEMLIVGGGVADRVIIIPPVHYNDLLNWTASADIGLIIYPPDYSPNVRMMLPNKLFEFLMAGLPVLSSQIDPVVEVIKTYDVGQVVTSLEPTDIGKAINAMLADGEALARMHRNALQVAQQELNWEKEQQRLINLYYDVLANQRKCK